MPSSRERSAGDRRRPRVAERPPPHDDTQGSPLSEPIAERAAWALWGLLAALALVRIVSSLVPGMALWGFNLGRFLPPLVTLALAVTAAAPLLPFVARPLAPPLERVGEAVARSPALVATTLAAVAALLVWVFDDRAWMVGDFIIRFGAASASVPTQYLFPQALPLDLYLHHTVPSSLSQHYGWDSDLLERVFGAAEAAAMALLCVALPRALRLRGLPAATTVVVALFGGYLCMFTGYGKAFREMCLLVAATAVFGLRALRDERAMAGPAIAAALGFVLHRSSMMFLPPLAALVALGAARGADAPRRKVAIAWSVAALVVFAVMAPRTIAVIRDIDRVHFEPLTAGRTAVGSLVDPVHVLDVVSVIAQVAPLAFALPLLLPLLAGARRREAAFLGALLLPLAPVLLAIYPRQGAFRDWDVFTPVGVGLSFAAAWGVGRLLERAPRLGFVAVAACAGVVAPALGWLVHFHDLPGALRRVEAYLIESPARPDAERAPLCDYLGIRYTSLGQLDAAADAYARAVQAAPSPRMRYEWAAAEAARGRLRHAQSILLDLTGIAPQMALAWSSLARVSLDLHEFDRARAAAEQALKRTPQDPTAVRVMQELAERAAADTTVRRAAAGP